MVLKQKAGHHFPDILREKLFLSSNNQIHYFNPTHQKLIHFT